MAKFLFLSIAVLIIQCTTNNVTSLELRNGAYEGLVLKVSEEVPEQDCRIVLDNLKAALISASQFLFSALDGRAFLRSATILLPPTWSDSCAPLGQVTSGAGHPSDVTILPENDGAMPQGHIYTQQSMGCGQPGDQIFISYQSLMQRDHALARTLVKEFAKYRYGVFEEQGYTDDSVYPMCYFDDQNGTSKITGCSDLPIKDNGICNNPALEYNVTRLVDPQARSSIMFAAESPAVSMFCDDGNHDRYAPTKHNSMCGRRSVLDVILSHQDFQNKNQQSSTSTTNNIPTSTTTSTTSTTSGTNQIIDTTPHISYQRQNLTRYVFVLENTENMMRRESWSYLRLALRHWALYVLPDSSEIGIVLAEESRAKRALNLVSAGRKDYYAAELNPRDKFYSTIPYTPLESRKAACIHCAVREANSMLAERAKKHAKSASEVIVVIGAGTNTHERQLDDVLNGCVKRGVRIASITYPAIARGSLLNSLAEKTGGVAYSVFEKKLNVDTSVLTTYFELNNVLYDIVQHFYAGSVTDLPIEIHRRVITDDGRNSITGSFVFDANFAAPSKFTFFTHNTVTPLIKSLRLTSPSHSVYAERDDRLIDFKMIGLNANITEAGTWTYTVEPYTGNPQPHFVQVMATPLARTDVLRASLRIVRGVHKPLLLLVDVRLGDKPVLGAKVEVIVRKLDTANGTWSTKFELLDTGAGDPDVQRGDGVYSRYFNAAEGGAGMYTFDVELSDNGNTAYTAKSSPKSSGSKVGATAPCCGQIVPNRSGVVPISPFQRVLPTRTLQINTDEIANVAPTGRIGDLTVQVIAEDMKARLTWTAPDMGGIHVARYEVRYAFTLADIIDNFETAGIVWESQYAPLPLAAGSETTFNLDMSGQYRNLLDKVIYVSIKPYGRFSAEYAAPPSNWVRVRVPLPPPPPTVPPTYTTGDIWPPSNSYNLNNNANINGVESVGPKIARTSNVGLELVLPIAIGCLLLVILFVVYCYFCVVKKRNDHRDHDHKKSSPIKVIGGGSGGTGDASKLSSAITIVPGSPLHHGSIGGGYTNELNDVHHNQVGVPVLPSYEYEEETKKRYSLVNQQEQQLIEELKHQQQMAAVVANGHDTYAGLSVISNSVQGPILSPYNSWSASQLLHEHERRVSPLDGTLDHNTHTNNHHNLYNGTNSHEMLLGSDRMSLSGVGDMQSPPPVPPLPVFNGYQPVVSNYGIYGQQQPPQLLTPTAQQQTVHPIYQSMQRGSGGVVENGPFNASLQGSMSSVNSGDKKRRNVTMV